MGLRPLIINTHDSWHCVTDYVVDEDLDVVVKESYNIDDQMEKIFREFAFEVVSYSNRKN